jgi:hypothetical protein
VHGDLALGEPWLGVLRSGRRGMEDGAGTGGPLRVVSSHTAEAGREARTRLGCRGDAPMDEPASWRRDAPLLPSTPAPLRDVVAREAHASNAGGNLHQRQGAHCGQFSAGRKRARATEGRQSWRRYSRLCGSMAMVDGRAGAR